MPLCERGTGGKDRRDPTEDLDRCRNLALGTPVLKMLYFPIAEIGLEKKVSGTICAKHPEGRFPANGS